MKSQKKLLILPGDGVGPEVCNEARKVIDSLSNLSFELDIDIDLIGGASIDKFKTPLSSKVLDKARNAFLALSKTFEDRGVLNLSIEAPPIKSISISSSNERLDKESITFLASLQTSGPTPSPGKINNFF